MPNSPEAMQYCRSELDQLFMSDLELRALCESHGEPFVPDGAAASSMLCDKIETAIRSLSPLSVLRVGNGEGNAISMTKTKPTSAQISTFFHEFNKQNGMEIPLDEAVAFCHDVESALRASDVIGSRSFRRPEREVIEDHICKNNAYAALGILYAREFLQDGLAQGFLRKRFITSAWIHLDIMPLLGRLLNASESVIVITGRMELGEQFRSRLGPRLKDFIVVPVQGFKPQSLGESHYYTSFPKVSDLLRRQDLRGTLVLVGAGLFGKVYCGIARTSGAVAVDLGSTFDILAGRVTRPIHREYDLQGMQWM